MFFVIIVFSDVGQELFYPSKLIVTNDTVEYTLFTVISELLSKLVFFCYIFTTKLLLFMCRCIQLSEEIVNQCEPLLQSPFSQSHLSLQTWADSCHIKCQVFGVPLESGYAHVEMYFLWNTIESSSSSSRATCHFKPKLSAVLSCKMCGVFSWHQEVFTMKWT